MLTTVHAQASLRQISPIISTPPFGFQIALSMLWGRSLAMQVFQPIILFAVLSLYFAEPATGEVSHGPGTATTAPKEAVSEAVSNALSSGDYSHLSSSQLDSASQALFTSGDRELSNQKLLELLEAAYKSRIQLTLMPIHGDDSLGFLRSLENWITILQKVAQNRKIRGVGNSFTRLSKPIGKPSPKSSPARVQNSYASPALKSLILYEGTASPVRRYRLPRVNECVIFLEI
jgi:hypothetical protein